MFYLSFSKSNYHNNSVDDTHKRSKSQTMNSLKSKKVSKSQEQSVLLGNYPFLIRVVSNKATNKSIHNKASYNLVNEYLENPGKIIDCEYANLMFSK